MTHSLAVNGIKQIIASYMIGLMNCLTVGFKIIDVNKDLKALSFFFESETLKLLLKGENNVQVQSFLS